MKKLSIAILLCSTIFLMGMGRVPPTPPELPKTIKEIVAQEYPNGNVLIGSKIGIEACIDLVNEEFGHITSGLFRQKFVHPEPGVWNYDYPDAVMENAAEYNQTVYMHSPISRLNSAWVKDDSRTPAELETMLKEFVEVMAAQYSPEAMYMEVVNEVVDKGDWSKPKPGTDDPETPWYILGLEPNGVPRYIKMAFETAMQHADPNVKLGWNHHEPLNANSWGMIHDTVLWLKSEGIRIDYIGWQGHVSAGWETQQNLDGLRSIISAVHSLDMDFVVTELEVYIKNVRRSPSSSQLNAQAKTYKAIIDTVLEFKDTGTVSISLWAPSDVCTSKDYWFPGLFDKYESPKPAYNSVQDALLGN